MGKKKGKKSGTKQSETTTQVESDVAANSSTVAVKQSAVEESKVNVEVSAPSVTADAGESGEQAVDIKKKLCARCFKPSSSICSKCKSAYYCSRKCQLKDWRLGHKVKCDRIKKGISVSAEASGRQGKQIEAPRLLLEDPKAVIQLFHGSNLSSPGNQALSNGEMAPGRAPLEITARCGLKNIGNTCYINAVLNCLSFTRPLVSMARQKLHSKSCSHSDPSKVCIMCLLESHISTYHESTESFIPREILGNLQSINRDFHMGRQEDANEFTWSMLASMQESLLAALPDRGALDMRSQETTAVHQLFGGHFQSQIRCTKCGAVSNSYEPFVDMSLEILEFTETLQEMLEAFTKHEVMDGKNKYFCNECNDRVPAEKCLAIHDAPNILTVHLKRFRPGVFGKINQSIAFDHELSLYPFMSDERKKELPEGSPLYRLFGMVIHLDMFNISSFGHYVCIVRDSDNNWFVIDDEKVHPIKQSDVLKQNAYMLFYERCPPSTSQFDFPDVPVYDPSGAPLGEQMKVVESKVDDLADGLAGTSLSRHSSTGSSAGGDASPSPCKNGCGFFG